MASHIPFFRFLDLHPELRNRIYEFTLSHNLILDKRKRAPGLLLTCKQIHHEAIRIHYASPHFLFFDPDHAIAYLTTLPSTSRKAITSIKYDTVQRICDTVAHTYPDSNGGDEGQELLDDFVGALLPFTFPKCVVLWNTISGTKEVFWCEEPSKEPLHLSSGGRRRTMLAGKWPALKGSGWRSEGPRVEEWENAEEAWVVARPEEVEEEEEDSDDYGDDDDGESGGDYGDGDNEDDE